MAHNHAAPHDRTRFRPVLRHKFRLRLHGIYLSLFESPLPNGPVQKLSDAFARTHSRI